MKKAYQQPEVALVALDMNHSILAGSQHIHISKNPVDHFDGNQKTDNHPIWE